MLVHSCLKFYGLPNDVPVNSKRINIIQFTFPLV